MSELLTAAQMRAIEKAAIASGEVTGLELMERAGHGVVAAIFEEWPELLELPERGPAPAPPKYLKKDEGGVVRGRRAVVLCGPGNNGGDGFVVARLLHQRGWVVEVFLYGDAEKLPPDARVNYERWQGLGEVRAWDDLAIRKMYEEDAVSQYLIVDALFGIGLTRQMPDDTNEMWHGFMPTPITTPRDEIGGDKFVAVDIASGISSDTGECFGALPVHLTVTFHRAKIGHFAKTYKGNYGGEYGSGKVVIKDIGLEPFHTPENLG